MPTLLSRRHGSGFVVFAYRDRARPLPLGYWENYVKTKRTCVLVTAPRETIRNEPRANWAVLKCFKWWWRVLCPMPLASVVTDYHTGFVP